MLRTARKDSSERTARDMQSARNMVPRQVLPGRTHLISRRCTQRMFLLRPDDQVAQIYLYCLGEAAARYDITLHAWIAMSNHHHLVIRDNHGNYPEFLAHFHKMIAKAMNAYLGRRENFWASEQPSVVRTIESSDRFDKLVYLLANPVADDLVDRVTDWPGAFSLSQTLTGRPLRVKRPRDFFRDDGPMPKEVVLRASPLDGFADLTDAEWQRLLLGELAKKEREARARRREENRGVLGRKAVLRAERDHRPSTIEPRTDMRPSVACKNKERRQIELGLLKGFRVAYRAALALWRGGDHTALFPAGTYRMRWFGAVTPPLDSVA